jgi:hypothetical protein
MEDFSMYRYMKPGIVHFKDAADVAKEVYKEFKNFGLLADLKLLGPENRSVVSVAVRPLLAEEYSEAIIANAKRVVREAWATMKSFAA